MKGQTRCAVNDCTNPITGANNLCEQHRLPGFTVGGHGDGQGAVAEFEDHDLSQYENTMIVTAWYAEHWDEWGIIYLCDWKLGVDFAGREGFERRLQKQGFTNVRNLTPAELDAIQHNAQTSKGRVNGKKMAGWGGPWLPEYPWEVSFCLQFISQEDASEIDVKFFAEKKLAAARKLVEAGQYVVPTAYFLTANGISSTEYCFKDGEDQQKDAAAYHMKRVAVEQDAVVVFIADGWKNGEDGSHVGQVLLASIFGRQIVPWGATQSYTRDWAGRIRWDEVKWERNDGKARFSMPGPDTSAA